eukprot:4679862-Amphidinium_carterae.1
MQQTIEVLMQVAKEGMQQRIIQTGYEYTHAIEREKVVDRVTEAQYYGTYEAEVKAVREGVALGSVAEVDYIGPVATVQGTATSIGRDPSVPPSYIEPVTTVSGGTYLASEQIGSAYLASEQVGLAGYSVPSRSAWSGSGGGGLVRRAGGAAGGGSFSTSVGGYGNTIVSSVGTATAPAGQSDIFSLIDRNRD